MQGFDRTSKETPRLDEPFLRPHSWYLQDTSLVYSDLAFQLDNCFGLMISGYLSLLTKVLSDASSST